MKAYKKYPYWKCDDDYGKYGCHDKNEMMDDDCHDMDMSCCTPKMKCQPTKECVKTYKCYYKLYKICTYRLYKVCPSCGHEFDYHEHRGACPKCM
ncbi:hypothetical protein SPSIL_001970 [Sporomusa silvacetica DSM 10669]|uniref:Uncharacterized protein n=1 Tax=Sporomusa silvacetica DSM 10669 TaxID=1123289 RepID=A0ABZ3IF16_9FIRM|nr:hypothetical protein [Sporomusa silvacetica]OZC17901.1 hypothetical protein SPSIL_30410 [Sporomusa silvacetica DSM 10669]